MIIIKVIVTEQPGLQTEIVIFSKLGDSSGHHAAGGRVSNGTNDVENVAEENCSSSIKFLLSSHGSSRLEKNVLPVNRCFSTITIQQTEARIILLITINL